VFAIFAAEPFWLKPPPSTPTTVSATSATTLRMPTAQAYRAMR